MTRSSYWLVTGCLTIGALMLGLLTLWPSAPAPRLASGTGPIQPRTLPNGLETDRRLFLDPINPGSAAPPSDAPLLAGIAGRLTDDAVAMVRDADGRTRIIAIGQSHRGWRLESLSGDAALFRRGMQQVRIALPAATEALEEDQ
jgi:hypothetical protein